MPTKHFRPPGKSGTSILTYWGTALIVGHRESRKYRGGHGGNRKRDLSRTIIRDAHVIAGEADQSRSVRDLPEGAAFVLRVEYRTRAGTRSVANPGYTLETMQQGRSNFRIYVHRNSYSLVPPSVTNAERQQRLTNIATAASIIIVF